MRRIIIVFSFFVLITSSYAYGLDDAKGKSNEFTSFEGSGRQYGYLVRCVTE